MIGAVSLAYVNERSRDDDGDYEDEYSDSDILAVVRANEPIGTGAVAEEIGCHRNTARARLKQLEERGAINRIEGVGPGWGWTIQDEP